MGEAITGGGGSSATASTMGWVVGAGVATLRLG